MTVKAIYILFVMAVYYLGFVIGNRGFEEAVDLCRYWQNEYDRKCHDCPALHVYDGIIDKEGLE